VELPEKVDHYRILRKLGEGGMGVVYAAEDERLDRSVALKMIRKANGNDDARVRFWREARAAARVSHPNVCQIYEVGEHQGELYLAMELLQGEPLADLIGKGQMSVSETVRTMLQILQALDALHAAGLVHRDLKPSNIFMTPVGPKILDFGLARADETYMEKTETALTLPGMLIGTPEYVAPERLQGIPADHRADVFAAGVILYEMLVGRPPFTGQSLMEILHAVLYERPPVLGGSPAIAAVDRVVRRALNKNPADRYPTARAMADELRQALALADHGGSVRARPMSRLIVLPFRILRPDPETDFLAFSLADAVTSSLSGLESLIVRSSATASRYSSESPDLAALAKNADVDIVLTGTLLRSGPQVRVTAQLVEAPAGTVLWSLTSQVTLGDIFQLQDTLAQRIVESLSVPLSAREERILKHDVPATAKAYEFYLRANQLGYDPKHWSVARDLYLQCLVEDVRYAPAWARMGRLYRVLGMYSPTESDARELYRKSEEAFKRALDLNPDLSLAHNLYTYLEVELGGARDAMLRLLKRAETRMGDPELFAGLVQACRYCGLLEASVLAHEEARRLDPEIRTSVNHSHLMLRDYERAIETNVEDPPTINALALALMGRSREAAEFLIKLEHLSLPPVHRLFISATRSLIEGRRDACEEATDQLLAAWRPRDPCAIFYLGRHLAFLGRRDQAVNALEQAVEGGFFPYRFLTLDPWLDPIRSEPRFSAILQRAKQRHGEAEEAFFEARGDRILGLTKTSMALPG
jgi:serine/threonine protein kinase/tetratricopeptide (TPR) repeat protein